MKQHNDALITSPLVGDEHALQELVARHHAQLVRMARMFVRDDATAEEVVQDVWVAVLTGLPYFEGRSSLKTWIFRILLNIAKTRGVRDRRVVPSGNPLDAQSDTPSRPAKPSGGSDAAWTVARGSEDSMSPERQLLDREALQVVTRAMGSLPASQYAVVLLRDVEGLDVQDVCKILGVSEANLRVLHHRARVKLRKAMQGYAA